MGCSIGSSQPINLLIDSGADINVLTERDWERVFEQLNDRKAFVYDVSSDPVVGLRACAAKVDLEVVRTFKAWVETSAKPKPRVFAKFAVIKGARQSLLGRDTASLMKLLKVGLGVNRVEQASPCQEFPSVPGIEVDFDIDESVAPVTHIYVSIPAHYQKLAGERLAEMERTGIIERVLHAPRWISGLSAVPKGKNNFRLVVNMRGPNRAIRRQFHAMPRIEQIKVMLNKSTLFTKLDLTSAFHHVKLAPRSRELTTFMAPGGMYRFTRLVFGVNCAPELFQRIMEEVLTGITNVVVYIDDILMYAENKEKLGQVTTKVLEALKRNHLTLNSDKCEYEKESLTFLGHTVSSRGLDIEARKVESIRKFRQPSTASELKSFLGLATYVSAFIPRFAELTDCLWMVSQKESFVWGSEQETAFTAVKDAIISCTTTQGYFDVDDRTYLYTDASPRALGAVLVQTNGKGESRIISFASKTLTKTERAYPQTQREALGIVWGAEHFYFYLLGHKFTIRTDALGISFVMKRDSVAPKRIMKRAEGWAMRLEAFDFDVEFIKGTDNIADPSSRLYEGEDEAYEEGEAPCEIASLTVTEPEQMIFGDDCLTPLEVSYHTAHDEELKAVMVAIETGKWEQELAPYRNYNEELTETDGLLTKLGLAIVPRVLRSKALHLAHKGHPGMTKMKSILKERVWWPGMAAAVETWVQSCKACTMNARSDPPTPMERTRLPEAPWELVALDFCGPYSSVEGGVTILGMVDYYSRYMLAAPLKHTDFVSVRAWLDTIFDVFGYPGAVKNDNGPPFNSKEWKSYCANRGIRCIFSWPLTPQQNGAAERAMATIGKAMKISTPRTFRKELADAMMAHNSAVHTVSGEVPENVMFGRRLRRSLPLVKSAVVDIDGEQMRQRDWNSKMKAKQHEDRKRRARDSDIAVGDTVVLRREHQKKGESNYGPEELTVVDKRNGDLTMTAPDGHVVRRNVTVAKKVAPDVVDVGESSQRRSIVSNSPQPILPRPSPNVEVEQREEREPRAKRLRTAPKHLENYIRVVQGEETDLVDNQDE